jgi:hypothetical protein
VFNFNAAEYSLRRLMWLLIDPRDEQVGLLATGGMDLVKTRETVLQLLERRQLNQVLVSELTELLARFERLRQDRNMFVHAIWRVPNEASDLGEMDAARVPDRRRSHVQAVANSNDPATIAAVATEAAAVGEQLDSTFSIVQSALPGAA